MASKRRKRWKRLITAIILIPIPLFGIAFAYLYANQEELIQGQISDLNTQHRGEVVIGKTHLKLFADFPNVSFRIDDVKVFEHKEEDAPLIVDVADIRVGFNLWDILGGRIDLQALLIEDGIFNLVLHEDGSINLQNALASIEETEGGEPLQIHLKDIELRNLDIHKLDESTHTDVEAFVNNAKGGFKSDAGVIDSHVDADFLLNIMADGDTTYIHHKHFEIHTDLSFDENTGLLSFKPSDVRMEHGDFNIEGSVDIKNDVNLDMVINGSKPNFDMLIAFAPEDLIPLLERYENAGDIYFNAEVRGPTLHGQMPFIDARFGASDAFLENTLQHKRVSDLGFKGHFTNGEERSIQAMEFSLLDMTAELEEGRFEGSVLVRNFEEPEVDMRLFTDFNLDFLARFLNVQDVVTASGDVTLEMKFHDIIDLEHPEKTLNELNRSYFTELKISDLSANSSQLPAELESLNAHLIMEGKEAQLDLFELKMGGSDLSMTGFISDLPSIVHHTDIPVKVHLDVAADAVDIAEITGFSASDSTGVDERIEDLSLGLSFLASARAFTESEYLPVGEFFVDSFHAQLKHYPHELHDFHADILIDDRDLRIVDFTGFVDDSDFHLNGLVHDYGFWMQDSLEGDVDLDLTVECDLLRLEDVFSYGGENYVPEDYRHEEFERLSLHVNSSMHYRESKLHSIDVDLDKLDSKLHMHPLRFEDFNGRIHFEDDHLTVENFHGKMGRTEIDLNAKYFLGEAANGSRWDNEIDLKANYIDFDELTNFNLAPPSAKDSPEESAPTTDDVAEHAEAFNLYELPFSNMQVNVDVGHFIYHRIDLKDIQAQLRTTQDHLIYVDTLRMLAAGGSIAMNGLFDGRDPEHIYVQPYLVAEGIDLERFLFKFENFGQDHLVSENLEGKLSAELNGKIRIYPDFVADLDQSEVHMDVQVLDGTLRNYGPMEMLSDYMGDKDLTHVRFDTLQNHIDINQGQMNIPAMTIESTLGHMEVSGTQNMDMEYDYQIRIPVKLISQAAKYKLFARKDNESGEATEDEIIRADDDKKTRYLNLKVVGNSDDFDVKLGKK